MHRDDDIGFYRQSLLYTSIFACDIQRRRSVASNACLLLCMKGCKGLWSHVERTFSGNNSIKNWLCTLYVMIMNEICGVNSLPEGVSRVDGVAVVDSISGLLKRYMLTTLVFCYTLLLHICNEHNILLHVCRVMPMCSFWANETAHDLILNSFCLTYTTTIKAHITWVTLASFIFRLLKVLVQCWWAG